MPNLKQGGIGWVRRAAISASVLALLGTLAIPSPAAPQTQAGDSAVAKRADSSAVLASAPAKALATAKLHANYGRLPLAFEPNRGQAGPGVKFLARGSGYALQLTPGEAVLALSKPSAGSALSRSSQNPAGNGGSILRWRLLGANPAPEVTGEAVMPGIVSYYSGANRANWLTNIPTYARVRYRGVLPGVDLVYYGHGRQLEYDFVVAPGADPNRIRLRFDGAAPMKVDSAGDLVIPLSGGEVRFKKPLVYQEENGKRRHVSGSYELLAKNRVGFRIGAYDRQLPLVIDPVLDYATYYGGSDKDSVNAITVDAAGNAFVAGEFEQFVLTTCVVGGLVIPCPKSLDAVISKIDPTGSTVLWTAFVGGGGDDIANAIALDSQGNVFVAGSTNSITFPAIGGFDQTCGTDGSCAASGHPTLGGPDGFVLQLSPDGTTILASTFLGGGLTDEILGMAVDASGVYVTGHTNPAFNDFPLVNPASSTPFFGTFGDIFVAKFTPDLSQLTYSTLFGDGRGHGIAVNAVGEAFVVGQSQGLAFTTPNAFGRFANGENVFLVKLSADGASVPYATYLVGGDSPSAAFAVALDSAGIAYLTGETSDEFFPMVNAFQSTMVYRSDRNGHAFVSVIDTSLSGAASLLYSTYLGRGGKDVGRAIALDAAGNVYVAGHTKNYLSDPTDPQFPLVNSLRPCLDPGIDAQGNWRDFENPFLSILNPSGSALLFSTCLGSDTERDQALAMALDASGNVYLGGWTKSAQFPVTPGAHGTTYRGNQDGFVAKLSGLVGPAPISISIDDVSVSEGNSGTTQFTFTVSLSAASTSPVTVDFATADGGATTADNDYTATSGTLTFAPGETVKTISVDVTGDTTFEPDETFFVDLSNPSGATISKAQGVGTIQNDDSTVTVTVQEVITVIDSPGLLPAVMLTMVESITVLDTPIPLPAAQLNITEAVSVTETQGGLTGAQLNINEAVTVTETQGGLTGAQLNINEAVTVNETLGGSLNNTLAGPNIVVAPVDLGTGIAPVTVTFANVTQAGNTTLVIGPAGPPPPAGFVPGTPSLYYDVSTTAVFIGGAQVCVSYAGTSFRGAPSLWHFENGAWVNITTSVDRVNQIVCGNTTSLSPFALFEPANQLPSLILPGNIVVEATGAAGAAATYVAAANDPEDGALPVGCVPASGSAFPLGATTVNCTVSDSVGAQTSGSFNITVVDTTPPVLSLPASITAAATSSAGAAVNFSATAADLVDGAMVPNCSPAPGATFAIGSTTVSCTATDAHGNSASGSFTVTVNLGTPRIAAAIAGKGRDSAGNFYVDLRLTNTGDGHARNLRITGLTFRTLSGTGTVGYNTTLSPPLPLSVGSLDVGAATVVRLYLNVPSTVTRFSITEGGTLQNVAGTASSFSLAQSVIP